jgi:hypothetical protein
VDRPPDIRAIARDVKDYLREYEALFGGEFKNVNWQPADGFMKMIVSCALIKQHDDLDAIADLVLLERGDAAVACFEARASNTSRSSTRPRLIQGSQKRFWLVSRKASGSGPYRHSRNLSVAT